MDKSEYRTKIDEMREFIEVGRGEEALETANAINWRKVHNVNSLVSGSEIYEACGKYEEARDLLLLAHERSPIGRNIIYNLSMICLKLDDLEGAESYCKQYVEIAPHDSKKYLLRYHIAVKKGADVTVIIKILEQLKEADFTEEWGYELAYLYHKTGQKEKCVDVCNEIILWFGEGVYVEHALELKLLYQPLDKAQEEKYRHIQQRKDGITEISAGDTLLSGEIISKTITIPSVELPPERFNTINLQAEIKKSIDEIMNATEAGAVTENIQAIKSIANEVPYLRLSEAEIAKVEQEAEEEIKAMPKDDTSINDRYKSYLEEEYDGQISFLVPANGVAVEEEQVQGQMTIDDIMEEWAKMARAAEAALEEARVQELQEVKARALKEANQVLSKLEEVMSAEEPMAAMVMENAKKDDYEQTLKQMVDTEVVETVKSQFNIPKLDADGNEDGQVAIPVVHVQSKLSDTIVKEAAIHNTSSWNPPKLEEPQASESKPATPVVEEPQTPEPKPVTPVAVESQIPSVSTDPAEILKNATSTVQQVEESLAGIQSAESLEEASALMANVNEMLQKEIDKLTAAAANQEEVKDNPPAEDSKPVINIDKSIIEDEEPIASADDKVKNNKIIDPDAKKAIPKELKALQPRVNVDFDPKIELIPDDNEDASSLDPAIDNVSMMLALDPVDDEIEEETDDDSEKELLPLIDLEAVIAMTEESESPLVRDPVTPVEISEDANDHQEESSPAEVTDSSADDIEPEVAPEPVVEVVTPEIEPLTVDQLHLSYAEKEIFSYFMPIDGMEAQISNAMVGAINHIERGQKKSGHIVIEGEAGTGKTQLATGLVKALQSHIGRPAGGIGRISGDKINQKDIRELFTKIVGGSLVIESAGRINRETAINLGLMMNSDISGILVILEDNKKGIEKAMNLDPSFTKMFTEKISIPAFSIDDLVAFAKQYAKEAGYSIDEMGTLALYNRINSIGRYNHTTSVSEVSEIMDEAIESAEKVGFFAKHSSKRTDEEGLIILREKDFDDWS